MTLNWEPVKLADLTTRITYGFTNPMPTTETGPVMVTARDIRGGRIDYATARRTSPDAYQNLLTDKSRPRIGDVLLTKDGSIGRIAVCDRDDVCINQSVALIQLNERVRSAFLAYLLQSPLYQDLLEQGAQGSTIKHIYISRVGDLPINLPPLHEQQAIAEVLGALDDKIAANTALTGTADELMHRSLLSPSSGPRVPLSSTANFVNGKAFTKGASGTGRVVVRIAELNSGITASTVFSDAVVGDDHVARPGDILFAWSGSLTLHRWFRDEAIVNQHIFKVIPGAGYPSWLVYELLRRKLSDFKAIAADKATTMGHIQRHHLDELIELPSPEVVDRLNPLMSGLWRTVLNAQQESMTLAATRDALLPQLMSGKLRVRDAEAAASAAGA